MAQSCCRRHCTGSTERISAVAWPMTCSWPPDATPTPCPTARLLAHDARPPPCRPTYLLTSPADRAAAPPVALPAGGDLRLQSIPGYGVDAHLTLRKLEEHEWQERVDEPTSLPLSMAGACR